MKFSGKHGERVPETPQGQEESVPTSGSRRELLAAVLTVLTPSEQKDGVCTHQLTLYFPYFVERRDLNVYFGDSRNPKY